MNDVVADVDFRSVYERLTGVSTAEARRVTRTDYAVICPLHHDTHPSLHIDFAGKRWYCPVCCVGGGVADFIVALRPAGYAGGRTPTERRAAAFAWLREQTGAALDLRPMPPRRSRSRGMRLRGERCTIFDYVDALGALRYQVLRYDGLDAAGRPAKRFRQRRPLPPSAWHPQEDRWEYRTPEGTLVGSRARRRERRPPGTRWLYSLAGLPSLLYRLPEVLAAARAQALIVLVEGEKNAEALRQRTGLCVTTVHNGAGAQLESRWLFEVAGASRLWVVADADPLRSRRNPRSGREEVFSAGRDSALERGFFFRRTVFDVRVLDLYPQREDGSDIEDWLAERPRASGAELIAELERIAAAIVPLP